jgi:polysaccharide pyruvyl transferase WcaK-like protein
MTMPPGQARVALMGYYGARNLGDDLMLVCLERWLRNQGYQPSILAENAVRVRDQFGFEAIQNVPFLGQFGWAQTLARLRGPALASRILGFDALLAGGGDILRDAIGWRGFSYQVEKLALRVALGKPAYLVNVGITQPTTSRGRKILGWLLPRLSGIIVRDRRSLRFCREIGARAVLAPDIVTELPALLDLRTPPETKRDTLLIALHHTPNTYRQFDLTGPRESALAAATSNICRDLGVAIEFLSCQQLPGGRDDHETHRRLAAHLDPSIPVSFLDWTSDPVRLHHHFSRARCVLAMRLHAGVLAATFGRPCVLLPYERKVTEFGEAARIPHLLDEHALDDPARIESTIREAAANGEFVLARPEGAESWLTLKLETK